MPGPPGKRSRAGTLENQRHLELAQKDVRNARAELAAMRSELYALRDARRRLQEWVFLSPVWPIVTGLTCNVADAQSAREFIAAWLMSRESLEASQNPESLADSFDADLSRALKERTQAVESGAGRLFRVRTQVGFLNVHSEPGDPFRTDNVVAQLQEGEIVQVTLCTQTQNGASPLSTVA